MSITKWKDNGLEVVLITDFLLEAEALYNKLEEEVEWNRNITPGRRVHQDYGDPGTNYKLHIRDTTITRNTKPWLPILLDIRAKISAVTKEQYRYCVVQRYPSGSVGIAAHKDKEAGSIVGLSLGATRTLVMSRSNYADYSIPLPAGSLYIITATTNKY